ncbi:hypothetical protein [Parabacteroides sp.]
MGNIDSGYTGCAILNIPDDPHPWNALRSVIDQFYQRERDIASERYDSRKATEKAKKLEERNNELTYQLEQVQTELSQLKSQPAYLSPLEELLALCDAEEWVDSIDSIIDCLISLMCNDKDMIGGSDLYYARRLREFFVKLSKAEQLKDIDPTSKYI